MALVREFKTPFLRLIKEICMQNVIPPHQLEHYNDFIVDGNLEHIVEQEVPIQISPILYVTFQNTRMETPRYFNEETQREEPLFPETAVISKQTYAGIVSADAVISKKENNKLVAIAKKRIDLFQMPTMVGSARCNIKEKVKERVELGGHFIINGTHRVLIPFERPNYNTTFVGPLKNNDKFNYICEFRSRHQDLSILVQAKRDPEGYIFFSLPYLKSKLPAGHVLCALGVPFTNDELRSYSEKDMRDLQRFLRFDATSMDKLRQQMTKVDEENGMAEILTCEEGFLRMQKLLHKGKIEKSVQKLKDELKGEIFVHSGFGTFRINATYLLYLMRLLEETATEKRQPDDKESLIYKRVDTAYNHLGQLIRPFFRKSCKLLKNHFDKLNESGNHEEFSHEKIFSEIQTSMENSPMTGRIQTCFSTGRWDTSNNYQKQAYVREGVSQVLNQQNLIQRMSHMKRLTQPIDTNSINVKIHSPRLFSPSHQGFIDPYETPEGGTVGIVCNLACSAQITMGFPMSLAVDRIYKSKNLIKEFNSPLEEEVILVSVDGLLIGYTQKPSLLLKDLNDLRKFGHLPRDCGISQNGSEIRIYVDDGRFTRPLIVVENNLPKWNANMSLAHALQCRAVALVTAEEVDTAVVATSLKDLEEKSAQGESVDYLEIHPTLLFSENSTLTTYLNCNQAPRNTYVTSMRKQSVGVPFRNTLDTNSYALHYPQKPLVSTLHHRLLEFDEEPLGSNPVIAVMTIGGWNQEDSVVINKASIERGLFNTTWTHVITEKEKGGKDTSKRQNLKKTGTHSTFHLSKCERWELLDDSLKNPQHLHSDLDERGIILPHSKRIPSRRHIPLSPFQVLISKKGLKKIEQNGKLVEVAFDASRVVSKGSEAGGFVEKVDIGMSPEGLTIVHISLRFPKIPEVGDKVASSHGQKGIIGKIFAQEDMPTTACGMTPDLIINPHAFPSRMTINYLEEMGMSNIACKYGRVDGTPFEHDIAADIKKYNVPQEQILYDGITGKKFPTLISIGSVNYHVLSQFVSKKSYARGSASSGPVDSVRQPVSGRSREGGLRFGEMERDAVIAHGASETLHDRMFTCSDVWNQIFCKKCQSMTGSITCHICLSREHTRTVDLSFATKNMANHILGSTIKLAFEIE